MPRSLSNGATCQPSVGSHWRIRGTDILAFAARREHLGRAVDKGVATIMAAGTSPGPPADAKTAWREASDDERAHAIDVVRSATGDAGDDEQEAWPADHRRRGGSLHRV